METIVSLAEQHIKNNRKYFIDKYYERHSEGAVILFFNEYGFLHKDKFLTKNQIRFSSELPDNAYSEAKDYWDKFPHLLVFMSWFYPITYGTSFSVYATEIERKTELTPLLNNWVDISSSKDCQALIEHYQKVSRVIEANLNNAEAYWIRAEVSRVIFVAYARHKHYCLERFIKETFEKDNSKGYFTDLIKAASLGYEIAKVQVKEMKALSPDLF